MSCLEGQIIYIHLYSLSYCQHRITNADHLAQLYKSVGGIDATYLSEILTGLLDTFDNRQELFQIPKT